MRTTDFSRAPAIGQASAQFVGGTSFSGLRAFFDTRDDLLAFARTPEHARIMRGVMRPGNAHGGFIRLYEALPAGYSSGGWRAEAGHEMRAIEQFSPLAQEVQGPTVPPDRIDQAGSRPSDWDATVHNR